MTPAFITFPLQESPLDRFAPGSGDSLIGSVVPLRLHGRPDGEGTVVSAAVVDGQMLVTMELTGEVAKAVGAITRGGSA